MHWLIDVMLDAMVDTMGDAMVEPPRRLDIVSGQ